MDRQGQFIYSSPENLEEQIKEHQIKVHSALRNIGVKSMLASESKRRRSLIVSIPHQSKDASEIYSPMTKDLSDKQESLSVLEKIYSKNFLEDYGGSNREEFENVINKYREQTSELFKQAEVSLEAIERIKNPEKSKDNSLEESKNNKGSLSEVEKEQVALQAIGSLRDVEKLINKLSVREQEIEVIKKIREKTNFIIKQHEKEFNEDQIRKDAEDLLDAWPEKIKDLKNNERYLTGERSWFATFLEGIIDLENIRKKSRDLYKLQEGSDDKFSKTPKNAGAVKQKKAKSGNELEDRELSKNLKSQIRDLNSEIEDLKRKIKDLENQLSDLNTSLREEKELNQKSQEKRDADHERELEQVRTKKDQEYSKYINPVKFKKISDFSKSQSKILELVGIECYSEEIYQELLNTFGEKNALGEKKTIWDLIDNAEAAGKDVKDWKNRTSESDQRKEKAEKDLKEKIKELNMVNRELDEKARELFKLQKRFQEEIEYLEKKIREYEEELKDEDSEADEESLDAISENNSDDDKSSDESEEDSSEEEDQKSLVEFIEEKA